MNVATVTLVRSEEFLVADVLRPREAVLVCARALVERAAVDAEGLGGGGVVVVGGAQGSADLLVRDAAKSRLRYERFPPAEARRILERLEFHFTPKHASWLNMVEIEIGVMVSQCLDRRIPDKKTLVAEVAAWERRRTAEGAQIDWMFTIERARQKLGASYPSPGQRPVPTAA